MSTLLLPITLVLLIFFTPHLKAQDCRSVNRVPGSCVSLRECPPFAQILRNKPKSPSLIRQLQKITCAYYDNDIRVCCPLNKIVTTPRPSTTSTTTTTTTTTPATTITTIKPPQSTTKLNDLITNRVGLRSHRNFQNLPDLKGCSNSVVHQRIIGGKDVEHGTYPWMARVGYRTPGSSNVEFYCGGTIISSRYILTAAHCTNGLDEENAPVKIRLGEYDVSSDEDCAHELGDICSRVEDYKIEKVISHENYSAVTKHNDIAIIRVDRVIQFTSYFIRPVCLPFTTEYGLEELQIPELGIAAGWGRTVWNKASGSNKLQEVSLPIKPNDECQANYSRRVIISPDQLCAGGETGKDSCGGDSGGPLMIGVPVRRSTSKIFQIGVVSFGPVQCGVGDLPGVYIRVSNYLKWILDNIEP